MDVDEGRVEEEVKSLIDSLGWYALIPVPPDQKVETIQSLKEHKICGMRPFFRS